MGKVITISMDENIERQFRTAAVAEFGKRKGYLGEAIEQAVKLWIRDRKIERIRKEAFKELEKGYKMGGKLLYKERGELHER